MEHKYRYFLLLLLGISSLLGSCKKFLDVQPEDKYTEEQVYANERAIQQGLNGLYMNLSANTLYGANLSTTTIELLAQRYNVILSGNNSYLAFQQYGYTNTNVMDVFNTVWTQAYGAIVKTNKFISALDQAVQNRVISVPKANLLKGEALGIRAMVHFDLLRLFGPVMAVAPNDVAIPYYTKADGLTRPIIPANQVVDSVLTDLSAAKLLLAEDPIINNGVTIGDDFYQSYRNQRMNYYAVMGLEARVYLYGGYTAEANSTAKQLLTEGEKWFPWTTPDAINNGITPDRVFSPEIIFGLYNQDLYTNYNKYFNPALLPTELLTALPARLVNIFEGTTSSITDYRYTKIWKPENVAAGTLQTSAKFAEFNDQTKSWKFLQPLLRKTELYYILAETEPDPATALGYLNTVRLTRNIATNLTSTAIVANEVQKEYQKEFWQEGQLFFYYKRTNKTSIPSGVSTGNITMNATKYVVPLPLSETTPR